MVKVNTEAPEQRQWYCSVIFLLDFEHISHLVLLLLLLILSMSCQLGLYRSFVFLFKRTCGHLDLKGNKKCHTSSTVKGTSHHLRYQYSFALWTTLQSSNFSQWWNFPWVLCHINFCFSIKVYLRFHCWSFFIRKRAF